MKSIPGELIRWHLLVPLLLAAPPRQSGWTCKKCDTWNESFRTSCMNGCR